MTQVYTAEEVARHNHEKDLWMVMNGCVYDLTRFVKEHPGGEEVLVELAGKDGTACFNEIGHSNEAVQLREDLKIGTVTGNVSASSAPPTSTTAGTEKTVDDDDWEYQEPKYEASPWLPSIAAAGVVIYAIIFYYLWFT